MGWTRDLIKIIRDTKETFHSKMGTIKDRNGMDLMKQKTLRRGGKNTQNYTTIKKNLNDLDNHDDMIILLELDILESKSSGP